MPQENSLKTQYHSFIQEICTSEPLFYAFTAYDKPAEILSKDQKDKEHQPKVVLCFWASEKQALEACKNENWQGYRVVPVSLLHFLENWCIDMADEGVLVGINFDNQAVGIEINPLDLILEILTELKRIKKHFICVIMTIIKPLKMPSSNKNGR